MEVLLDNLDSFEVGIRNTVALALASFAGALAIGLVVATFRVSPVLPLRAAGTTYVEVVRNIPPLVLIFLFFFGFPNIGIVYSPFISAAIVLAAYTGAFVGEAIRAGINTVARGQAEAARALGMTFRQTLGLVVMPQALRSVVPPMGNLFIALVKNTSLASTISVFELTFVSKRLITDTAQGLTVFFGTALAYLLLTLPAGWVVGRIERRAAIKR
ncbi:MAG TPA: amino acid ABC transporter permease [Actinomycetota bacterium]|nr:amino acid ABC transporter permease [Actinomycetota bacterium]